MCSPILRERSYAMTKPIPLSDLVRACAYSNDPVPWDELVRRLRGFILAVALSAALKLSEYPQRETLDDLVQEVFLKLCADERRLLKQFNHVRENSFLAYLRDVTESVVCDSYRSQRAQKRGMGRPTEELTESMVASGPSPIKAMEIMILWHKIDAILKAEQGPNVQRDRTIFLLYFRQGLTAAAIAKLPGINLTTEGVESTILRLVKLIKDRLGL